MRFRYTELVWLIFISYPYRNTQIVPIEPSVSKQLLSPKSKVPIFPFNLCIDNNSNYITAFQLQVNINFWTVQEYAKYWVEDEGWEVVQAKSDAVICGGYTFLGSLEIEQKLGHGLLTIE